jgi:hypothetical protein
MNVPDLPSLDQTRILNQEPADSFRDIKLIESRGRRV